MIEIIPAIDIIGGRCVRLSQGDYSTVKDYRSIPSEMVKKFVDYGLKRIHAVDLEGARLGRPVNLLSLEKMASVEGAEIEWGGGIKTDSDIRDADNAGASYMVIGSVAVKNPDLFSIWLHKFGEGRMVLGADVRNGKIAVTGWTETSETGLYDLIGRFRDQGLTQAIVTDIACDGMLQGPSFDLYSKLQEHFPEVTITVSGGVSDIDDIRHLDDMGLRRVIVGKALYEGHISLKEIRNYIENP